MVIHAEFRQWPVAGEIRLLNKEVIPIPIDPEAAIAIAKEAETLRQDYNARIESGASHSELARYSAEGCAFCEFKAGCDTFWQKNPQPTPGIEVYGCLSGRILKIASTESGVSRLVIESEKANGASQRWEITNLSMGQFEDLSELTKGDTVRLLNFSIASDAYRAKPTTASVVWKLPDGL